MWTRRPGDTPFSWLGRVAAITDPALLAQLRTASPAFDDAALRASTVTIDGVYRSAVDPGTVTVTCVARLVTDTGLQVEPCASTVTVAVGPGGRLWVEAVG
jgi:hypothetical protein